MKLGSGVGKHITNGPVLYYSETTSVWEAVCDGGFNDYSATLVCQDLGFSLGRAILASAFGKIFEDMLENKTLPCRESVPTDRTIDGCFTHSISYCNQTSNYASVVCFDEATDKAASDDSKCL